MKRNAGLAIAAALALTAAVRIPASHGPATSYSEIATARPPVHSTHAQTSAGDGAYSSGCTAYDVADDKAPQDDNRGAAKSVLDKFFASAPQRDSAQNLRGQAGVRYVIALAADPRHTNLSLVFDRQMAAIQEAAQDESYTYDSSWLPWNGEKASYPLLADQQAADEQAGRREACPGVLLFRKSATEARLAATDPYQQALIVLVVGEQPTGGLNEDQWTNAIRWLGRNASDQQLQWGGSSLQTAPRVLRILGPSFSGSLVSLGRNLGQIYPSKPDKDSPWSSFNAKFPEARVLSGSVSDCESIRWFQQLRWPILNDAAHAPRPAVIFGTFEENDDRQIYSFLNYLESQGTSANDTATLSEDETAYSGGPEQTARAAAAEKSAAQPCTFHYASAHRPVSLYYPRDISALRSAYEKESIFTSSSSGHSDHTVHTILQEGDGPSDEGGNPSDTIQAYSRQVAPLAQEAVLYGNVSYMRAHHTRYLLLRCTNTLDFLFLTRFFHRAYPEGRIVTVGADLLFRREIDTTEFRGVLALSNYPLLPRNQHWSMLSEKSGPIPGHAHRTFESAAVEGGYLAGRYLFSSGRELSQPEMASTYISLPLKELLPDYADPYWLHAPSDSIEESRAPVWLVVVGRDGYWPLAVFNDHSTPEAHLHASAESGQPPPPSTMVHLISHGAHYAADRSGAHFNSSLSDADLDAHNSGRAIPSKLPLPWTLCALLASSLLLYQICGILLGDRNASQGLFSVFRRVGASSQDILLGLNSAFAGILLLVPLSIGLTLPKGNMFAAADWEYLTFLLMGIGGVVLTGVSLLRKRGWLAMGCFLIPFVALACISLGTLEATLIGGPAGAHAAQANRMPLFYRMGHMTSGVAPLLPVLFLFAGFYLWTWNAMAGNVLLCNGRPLLPRLERVKAKHGLARWYAILLGNPVEATGRGWNRLHRSQIRMSQEMGKRIAGMASPLSVPRVVLLLPLCLLVGSWVCFHADLPLLTLEGRAFAWWLNLGLLAAFLLVAAEASRLFWTWMQLRRLLSKLNRLRLRRTFARLRAVEANSLWSVSGGVQRVQYLFFSQQLEAATRLYALVNLEWPGLQDAIECGQKFDRLSARRLNRGPRWDEPLLRPSDLATVTIRDVFADAVAEVYNRILEPWWRQEQTSLTLATLAATIEAESRTELELPLCENATIRTAEEFVCFHYIAFIQNILARMRTMTLSMVLLFVSVSFAISFYPFVPRTQISMWMVINLALIGSAVVYVYAGMDRDEILSYITNTRPGKLSADFWLKSAAFLAGPVIGIITTQFPAVADSILGYVQPGLDAIGK